MKKIFYNVLILLTLATSVYGLIILDGILKGRLNLTTSASSAAQYGRAQTKETKFSMGGEKKQQQFTLSDKNLNNLNNRGILINGKNIEDLIKNRHICRWISNNNRMIIVEIYLFDKTNNAVILNEHLLKNYLDVSKNINKLFDENSYKLEWTNEYYIINNNLNNNFINFSSLRIHRPTHSIEIDYKDNSKLLRGNCIIND